MTRSAINRYFWNASSGFINIHDDLVYGLGLTNHYAQFEQSITQANPSYTTHFNYMKHAIQIPIFKNIHLV